MDEERLRAALRELAVQEWDESKRPVFLSHLPKILKDRFEIDYKIILGGRSVKQFILANSPDSGFKLVQHPGQRAKVGLVPSQADFAFPVDPIAVAEIKEITAQDVRGFLNILNNLPPEELARLQLPADIVVRLLKKI
ncbi:hypothetical protein [Xanthomonas arboricola]|uniref:hypothetical protein n=1 Tax=Xanthomonas arboricola TaxID=56448 RepID=UPI0011B04425|nr:hypothetical protein [Xanthomonas arboricola]